MRNMLHAWITNLLLQCSTALGGREMKNVFSHQFSDMFILRFGTEYFTKTYSEKYFEILLAMFLNG